MVETLAQASRYGPPGPHHHKKIPVKIAHYSTTIEDFALMAIFCVAQWAEARALDLRTSNTLSVRNGFASLINPMARD